MNNFFQTLLSSIKSRFISIWTRFHMWTSKNFVLAAVLTKIRTFFTNLFNVKPKNKKDYYGVFGWLISKRLAYAIMIVIGVLSVYYLVKVNPPSVFKTTGTKTYSYNSLALRFTKGNVNIKGKSGYLAYTGNVSKGKVTGQGVLYNPEGVTVYIGQFDNSKYNGAGKLYYDNAVIEYDGNFRDNLFEGKGILYRSNGSIEYDGNFVAGLKEGNGTLYDTADNAIYTGSFSHGNIVYSELIGKKTTDAAEYYTGKSTVYYDDDYYAVKMDDIDAVYYGSSTTDNIDQGVNIDGVYVLSSTFQAGEVSCNSVSDLVAYFGEPQYDGNTTIVMPEAVSIESMSGEEGKQFGSTALKTEKIFDNAYQVKDFSQDFMVYGYTFEKDGLSYTFFCNDRNTQFAMYQINQIE